MDEWVDGWTLRVGEWMCRWRDG